MKEIWTKWKLLCWALTLMLFGWTIPAEAEVSENSFATTDEDYGDDFEDDDEYDGDDEDDYDDDDWDDEDDEDDEEFLEVGSIESDIDGYADYEVTYINGACVEVSYIYNNVEKVKTVKIPETVMLESGVKAQVVEIADQVLQDSPGVTRIVIGNNVRKIGDNAFADSSKLTKVTIGKSVESIGKDAFKNCPKLLTVQIQGNTLKTIGDNAFQGDKKIKNITLGKNVVTIGKNAFNGCKGMKTITITGTKIKTFGKASFKGVSVKVKVKVPKTKLMKYKTAMIKKGGLPKKVSVTGK
ncbi:MAG: leucine-rich repeat domain-containing protein [Lachnospiraceae bacterium]|nr:leucine-rich repeat domain-containing protein [Lachnospiraceae bacterium]